MLSSECARRKLLMTLSARQASQSAMNDNFTGTDDQTDLGLVSEKFQMIGRVARILCDSRAPYMLVNSHRHHVVEGSLICLTPGTTWLQTAAAQNCTSSSGSSISIMAPDAATSGRFLPTTMTRRPSVSDDRVLR